MDNPQVAETLETIGNLLDLKGENPFKVRAYHNAARAIAALPESVARLAEEKRLGEIPGIGEALEEKITQLVSTGGLAYLEDLRKEVPSGLLELIRIPSLGPKKARILWKERDITDTAGLRRACLENRLLDLKGFGEKSQKKILEGIEFLGRHEGQVLLGTAAPVARALEAHLRACPQVARASVAGSLRRGKEVVRDIDLLASSAEPERVMDHFVRAEGVAEVLARGETKTSVRLRSGLQVDLRVVTDAQFPCALAYFTGSREHNVALRALAQKKGLKVNEYGLFRGEELLPCEDEAELHARLGLPFLPPELRENTGELDLAAAPPLLERAQIRGLLHVHSDWSDGVSTLEELSAKARSMGLRYLGIADHSRTAAYAGGLDEARLERQMEEIDRLNREHGDLTILKGVESDILPDGTLDLDPRTLGRLDFVVGSVHSRFDMGPEEMTLRICKALSAKEIHILGHPTGRLLLSREGYRVDLERVIQAARENHKILELNAHPQRLDLDWVHCRRARDAGVLVSINPDAHSAASLDDIEFGVATARRGWLEAKDVLNAHDLERVREILRG
jgi:DNA polymerase (family 10)